MITKEDVKQMAKEIIDTHDAIIESSGGEKEIRDAGGLEHASFEILYEIDKHIVSILRNKRYNYSHIPARIYELFATRHYFIDGNKRTAHILAKIFLLSEGYNFRINYNDAVKFIIQIADKKKSLEEIEEWIESNSARLQIRIDDYVKAFEDDFEEMKKHMEENNRTNA